MWLFFGLHECTKYRILRLVPMKCHWLFSLEPCPFQKTLRAEAAMVGRLYYTSVPLASVGPGSSALQLSAHSVNPLLILSRLAILYFSHLSTYSLILGLISDYPSDSFLPVPLWLSPSIVIYYLILFWGSVLFLNSGKLFRMVCIKGAVEARCFVPVSLRLWVLSQLDCVTQVISHLCIREMEAKYQV